MVGAIAVATAMPGATRASHAHADAWPAAARSMAHTVAVRWSAEVSAAARLGAEPPGRCRRLDGRHAACPIAIAVLANDAKGRRPWRCSAIVRVARAGDRFATQRTSTRCTPFPPASAVPDPAVALGTAVALDANGDIACLPANDGRVTCVMRYTAPTAEHCIAAASIPHRRPARSIALGALVCLRLEDDPQAVGRAQLLVAPGPADHDRVEARALGRLGVGAA
jgi:hypothetical protein